MTVQKLAFKPGVNRENTRYTTEGGWYECDKVRFRQGLPEKIGGWRRISPNSFLGTCRSIFSWVTLSQLELIACGTHLKYYINSGGIYNDVTPIRATESLTDPFTTVNGSPIVTVTDVAQGYSNNDFVTFSGATAVGGVTIEGEYQLSYIAGNTYTIDVGVAATSDATGGGSVTAEYQVNTGPEFSVPLLGWGASYWGTAEWALRLA